MTLPFSRKIWLVGLLVLAIAALLAVRALLPQRDETWQRIQAERIFYVATDASYPPFSVTDEHGNLFGFDIDLGDEIGRRWGVQVVYENLTYDALLPALVADRSQAVISAFVPQTDRLHEVAFTGPYFVGGTVAVIRAEGGRPLEGAPLDWAAGQRLAVEYGAGGDALARQWARRAVGIEVLPLPAPSEAMLAVEAGTADAALVDAISAYDFLLAHPALALAGPPLEPEPYAIAVSVDGPVLLEQLQATLAAMEADGTLPALRVKWFGEAAERY